MRIALIVVALVAFAANSLLCRRALGGGLIDPTAFTTIRLVSGALVLAALGGVVLLGEILARRLPVAGFLILGGVLTAILSRRR